MKLLLALVTIFVSLLTFSAHAASFDCSKAGTKVESIICSNAVLSHLDEVLAQNYKYLMASDIGDGARKDLRATQRTWAQTRNRCNDVTCLTTSYSTRIDQICGGYPVLSGAFPNCTSSEDALSESGSSAKPMSPSPLSQVQQSSPPPQPVNRPVSTTPIDAAVNRHAGQIAALGFSQAELRSVIYLKQNEDGPYERYATLEQYFAVLFDLPNVKTVSFVESGGHKGYSAKITGQPSAGILFQFEKGEAFPVAVVRGEQVIRLRTIADEHAVAIEFARTAFAFSTMHPR